MEPIFIDEGHLASHTIPAVELSSTQKKNNSDWFYRLRMEAEECILLLYDVEKCSEASQKLEHYLTKDLPDLETVVLSLLKAINATGRAKHLFRKGIYEIIRNHIWKTRSSSINLLLGEIKTTLESTENDNEIAELETCYAILTLISEDQDTLQLVRGNLHPEATSKTPAKMVSLILQTYKKIKFFWKKVWFPHVIRIEELAEKIDLEKKGLAEIKKYAYMHHHIDWKIMSIFFQRMLPIINNNHDEDLRDNAYWSSMLGKDSIKLPAFADPTPVLTRNGYAPLLCEKGRYSAVKFLIDIISKEKQDIDIVDDAIKHLAQFKKGEVSPKVKNLYVSFNSLNLCPIIKEPTEDVVILSGTHTPNTLFSDAEKIIKLKKMIAIFPSNLVPEEIINSAAKELGISKEISEIFPIKYGLLLKDRSLMASFSQILPAEEELLSIELLEVLQNTFHHSFKEVDPPQSLNSWANYTDIMLRKVTANFTLPISDRLMQTIQEIHHFFQKTRSNSDKLFLYEKVLQEHSRAAKEKKLNLIPSKACTSLDDPTYQESFNLWKKNHNLESIHIQNYALNLEGEYEFIFRVTDVNGLKTLIKTRRYQHNIIIEILERSSESFEKKIRQISLPPNKNAYIKVYETIDKMNQKGAPDEKDIFQIVHFFETVLIEGKVDLESVSISAVFFTTLFGFSKNNGGMGLPELNELNLILQRKLFISFLAQVYGKKHAEKLYKKDIEDALKAKSLILVPYSPKIPHVSSKSQRVIHFYNLAITFSEHENHELLIQAFGAVLSNVREMENARLVLYECSLALQKIFTLKNTPYYFTALRAAFYLRELRKNLFKIEILDLKILIHTILSKISLKPVHHDLVSFIDIIESCNTLIPYIYTNEEIIRTDSDHIQSSFNKVIKLANIVLQDDTICVDTPFFQKLCNLYVIINHLGCDWDYFNSVFPHIRSSLLQNSSVKNSIDILDILMNSAVKFFILKGEHSDLLITEISDYIDELLSIYNTHRYFLFSLGRRIFPISPVLWSTKALRSFSQVVSAIVTNLYRKELIDIDSYIEILNRACRLKNSLRLNILSEEISSLHRQLSEIFIQRIEELIIIYLVPLWQAENSPVLASRIGDILKKLSLEVQENEDFLRKIEYHYQKTVTLNQKNKIDLFQILISMRDRYNTTPTYKKLHRYLFKAYLTNGKIFEKRWGYDTLSEILDVPKGLITYLRLEDKKSNFLTALVTPIYMGNNKKVTGFGAGGKMKMKIDRHGNPNNPLMPMVNVTDLTDNKFGKILEIMTFKESYYYWQRMFHPILCDGSLVTGKFRVLYLDDNSVQFGCITNADGCGFVNAKILGKLYQNIRNQLPHSLRCPVQTHQAVHHNKESVDKNLFQKATDEIAVDSCEAIEEYLSTSSNDQASVRDLFSIITTGGIKNGRNFVVIPALDPETFIIPLSLGNSDVCLGKTPYEKLNDIILKQEHEVEHLKSADLKRRKNAMYVDSLCGFQHSFIATDGDKLIFNKGILVIIPEEEWTYNNADIIFCRKDQKVNSTWATSKKLPEHNEEETVNGVLSVIQRYGPGSFVAISPDQQIDILNADFDGDGISVNIKQKGTHIFDLMKKTDELFTPYSTPKIRKSFTSSLLPNGQYSLFKFDHIMQARTANLLSFYSKIFDIYIALNHQYQLIVARAVANMGILSTIIKNILIDESLEALQIQLDKKPNILIQRVLSAGVKAGSDAFKSKVDWTYLREFANVLDTIYDTLEIPKDLVYFKTLSIDMHTKRVDFEEVIARAKYQKFFFDSLPLHVLYKTLSNTPKYKLDRLSHLLESQKDSNENLQHSLATSNRRKNDSKRAYSHLLKNSLAYDTQELPRNMQQDLPNELAFSVESYFSTQLGWDISNHLAKTAPKLIQISNNDQELILSKDSLEKTEGSSTNWGLEIQEAARISEIKASLPPLSSEDSKYNQDFRLNIPLLLMSDEERWDQQNFPSVFINKMPLNMDMLHSNQCYKIAENVRIPAMKEKPSPATHSRNSENSNQDSIIKISQWDLLSAQIQHALNIANETRGRFLKSTAFWKNLFR